MRNCLMHYFYSQGCPYEEFCSCKKAEIATRIIGLYKSSNVTFKTYGSCIPTTLAGGQRTFIRIDCYESKSETSKHGQTNWKGLVVTKRFCLTTRPAITLASTKHYLFPLNSHLLAPNHSAVPTSVLICWLAR